MDKVPVHLLCLLGIHKRFHFYVPRYDQLMGPFNPIADTLSHDSDLDWVTLMDTLQPYHHRDSSHQVWYPLPTFVDAILGNLLQKRQDPEDLLVVPPAARHHVPGLPLDKLTWPSMPTSKPFKLKHGVSVTLEHNFDRANLRSHAIPSGLDRLKVPYRHLTRCHEV